uniref:Meiosis-specific kinetochore protein isoform X2 n=1 Tax=Phascolarctos cinereus TaxID=38626 RepID=A0A6P5KRP4_PHACI|nr:meiosis-specific kinetochore protein isoform X2 [Phascolarctos cinereus]
MWPQHTYGRRPRRPGGRLNGTPPPPGPSRGLPEPQPRDALVRGSKGKLQMKILPMLKENVEATQLHESPTTKNSMQLNVAHQKNLQKSHTNEASKSTNTLTPKESMTDDDPQAESDTDNTQISSGITSSSEISFSLLKFSDTNFYIETTSFEDSLSSFPSPEVFRGEEFLDNSTCKILPEREKTPEVKTKQTNSSVSAGKKNRGFLTSSPSAETGKFEINLSPVQKLSSEGELNPNTSKYIYSDEIVPASSSEEEKDSWEAQCTASEICCIIKSSPRNRCTEMFHCYPKGASKGVINEPVDKERLKTRGRMNTIENINTQWREEQTNSSFTIGEKNMGSLGSFPSTETGKFKAPYLTSEMCCVVRTSPQIRYTEMPCSPPKGMCKDMVKKQVDKEKLKTKGRVDTIEGTSNQWREEVMESRAQVERAVTAKVSCAISEVCCIVKTSPRMKRMKMPCCPPKRVPKDIIMTDEYDDSLSLPFKISI